MSSAASKPKTPIPQLRDLAEFRDLAGVVGPTKTWKEIKGIFSPRFQGEGSQVEQLKRISADVEPATLLEQIGTFQPSRAVLFGKELRLAVLGTEGLKWPHQHTLISRGVPCRRLQSLYLNGEIQSGSIGNYPRESNYFDC